MLADLGCRYVIVGHSERRQYFGETDATVDKKIGAVLAHGLTCIGCLGETLQEREAGQTLAVLERQVRGGFARHLASPHLVIAYEPVWAIGTGRTATPAQAQEAHAFLRGLVKEIAGQDVAAAHPHPVRRQRQAGQHRRLDGAARRGRRAGGRRQPGCVVLRPDREVSRLARGRGAAPPVGPVDGEVACTSRFRFFISW